MNSVVSHPKPRRVLHVLAGLGIGGIETWLYQLLRYLDRDVIETEILIFSPEVGEYERHLSAMGFRIFRCSPPRSPIRMMQDLRRVLKSGGYHAIHISMHLFSGIIVREAYLAGIPVRIVHSRNMGDSRKKTLRRLIYQQLMRTFIARYATHRFAVSMEAGELLFGRDTSSYHIVPSAIDLSRFREPIDRNEVRRLFGISASDIVVGHVGRMAPAKNHKLVIEVARAFTAKEHRARFVLVGDGPLRDQITEQVREYGIEQKVSFLGIRRDIPRLMKGLFDVLLFPSIWEGSPRVVVEAQAAGLPCVISSSISAHMDVVPDLIKRVPLSAKIDDWVRAIEWAVGESRRIDKEAAYQNVLKSDFSMEQQAKRLSRLYLGMKC